MSARRLAATALGLSVFALFGLTFYAAYAFTLWEWNPGHWGLSERGAWAFFTLTLGGPAGIATFVWSAAA